tara:strand:- start:630 stop:899 length:270 start_codon:yes stop_codon:yes gene_type:complete
MIELIGLFVFAFTTIVSLYIIINLYRKVDFLEQVLDGVYAKIGETITKMQDIDTSGAFESDDEVGTMFTMLKSEVDNLDNVIEGKNNAS